MAPRARKPRRFRSCKGLSFRKKAPSGAFFVFAARYSAPASAASAGLYRFNAFRTASMTASSPMALTTQPTDVVAFWADAGPQQWYRKSDAFDAEFRQRFETA